MIIGKSLIYLTSSILNKATPFLLLPILTQYLTTEEYGIVSLYQALIALGLAVIGMNLQVNISRTFHYNTKEYISAYISNIVFVLAISFLLFTLLSVAAAVYFKQVFGIPRQWYLLIPLISLCGMLNLFNLTILRNQNKAVSYSIFEVTQTIINLGISLFLVVILQMTWEGRLVGICLPIVAFGIIGIFFIYRTGYFTSSIQASKINEILFVSLPLVPHAIGSTVISISDRFFIERMISAGAVGIYSVAYNFGMVVMLFTDAFIKAWSPWFYKKLKRPNNDNKIIIVKYSYLYMLFALVGCLLYSCMAIMLIPFIVPEEYYPARELVVWVAIGYFVFGIYQIVMPYLVLAKKTHFLAFSTTIAAITNLIGNYILIQLAGMIGAVISTIVSFMVSSGLVWWYSNKIRPMPWNLFKQVSQTK